MPILSILTKLKPIVSIPLVILLLAIACMLPASSALASQPEGDSPPKQLPCYTSGLRLFDITISLNGDSSGVGDTVQVTLTVTPVQTYQNVRLWLNADSGGINIIDPPEVEYDSLPADVEQVFQASVELSSAGRAVLQGGVGFFDDGDSTETILSEEIYLIIESDRTSWSAAAFLVAAIDSLDHQLSSGQISQAEYDDAFLDLRTTTMTATVEIDSTSKRVNDEFVDIYGSISWVDRNGATHPVRYAPVEIVDEDLISDDVIATTTTDANGNFHVPMDPLDAIGLDIFIRVWARSDGFYIGPPGFRNDPESDNDVTYSARNATISNLAARDYTIEAVLDDPDLNSRKTWSVHDALVTASRYVEDKSGTMLSTIPVEFPGSRSFFSDSRNLIQIKAQRGDYCDVMHHEYGHYVAWAFGFADNPGGSHAIQQNMAETRGKQDGLRLAWAEAWATYFGLTAQFESSGAEGVPDIRNLEYNSTNFSYSLETDDKYSPKGEDQEVAVQRILWDLYDPGNEPYDFIALGDDVLWNTMVGAGITTLSEFWNALINGISLETQTEFGRIFAHHNVAPDPQQPPDRFSIPDLNSVPTFKWEKNGAGPSYKLDKFTLEFWDDDLQTLLFSTPELDTNEYTPTTAELEQIFTERSTCRWLVRGSNTAAPETGEYVSPARHLQYSVVIAFVIDNTGSMQQEIDAIREALLAHLATYPPDSPERFQLTTFKDEVFEGTPTDLATVTAQVEDLTASGGFDCPEASVQAIRQVADGLGIDGRILFATDASPHVGSNVWGTIRELRTNGVRVDVMLTGGCGGFKVPGHSDFSTISTNEPLMRVSDKKLPVDRGFVQLSSMDLTPLALGDNDFVEVALPFTFPFRGEEWNSVFVNADGYITFGEGIVDPYPAVQYFQLGPPRIAGFWCGFNPESGGQISAGEVGGEFHVVYDQVPFEFYPDSVASLTIILRNDGTFTLDLGQAQMPFGFAALCGATSGFLESLGNGAQRDLSSEPEPIVENEFGTAYEFMFSDEYDLEGVQLDFAPVTYLPPPLPVEYSAFEAYTAIARETGGIFTYQPEVNLGDSADKQRFQNTVFNVVQGGLTSSVALISPPEGPIGNTVVVSLTGSSTNFRSNTEVTFSGDGITVLDVEVVSPIELVVTLSIDTTATLGFRDVTAETDLTGGAVETALGVGAYEVVPALLGPQIISVSPIAAQAGQDLVVTVYGGGDSPFVDFTDATSVDFGDGITINSFQALGPKELEASVSIGSAAVSGPRDVSITAPLYVFEEYITGPFFVTFPSSDEVQLVSVYPQSASPGTSFSLSITGANTAFWDGLTTVSFSDTSISITDVTVSDFEHVTAQVQLDPSVAPGFQDVRVQTGEESLALLDAFLILELPCGDVNGDEAIVVTDIVYLVDYVFRGGNAPLDQYGGDVNCDGTVNVADAVYMVDFLFRGGAIPCAACP